MRRYHEEKELTHRKWKKQCVLVLGPHFRDENLKYIKPKGYFRKNKPLDCGNPQCHLCHNDKFPKRTETRQETLAELKLREDSSEM